MKYPNNVFKVKYINIFYFVANVLFKNIILTEIIKEKLLP